MLRVSGKIVCDHKGRHREKCDQVAWFAFLEGKKVLFRCQDHAPRGARDKDQYNGNGKVFCVLYNIVEVR